MCCICIYRTNELSIILSLFNVQITEGFIVFLVSMTLTSQLCMKQLLQDHTITLFKTITRAGHQRVVCIYVTCTCMLLLYSFCPYSSKCIHQNCCFNIVVFESFLNYERERERERETDVHMYYMCCSRVMQRLNRFVTGYM